MKNKISKGERLVINTLKKVGVSFHRETCIKDCKGEKKLLPFDFSIYRDGKLVALIEYDGIQHHIPTFGWEDYLRTKETDRIKEQYCSENNIPLLRIPYFKYKEAESMLIQFLKQQGVLKKRKVAV